MKIAAPDRRQVKYCFGERTKKRGYFLQDKNFATSLFIHICELVTFALFLSSQFSSKDDREYAFGSSLLMNANLRLLRVQFARFVQCALQFGRSSKKSAGQFGRSLLNFQLIQTTQSAAGSWQAAGKCWKLHSLTGRWVLCPLGGTPNSSRPTTWSNQMNLQTKT